MYKFSKLFFTTMVVLLTIQSKAQKQPEKKYPSLLWEITGKGMKKPSYLFGTMHVSNKMVFNLSDSFFYAIKNVDVVGLELNSEHWQKDMIEIEKQKESFYKFYSGYGGSSYNEDYRYDRGNYNFGFGSSTSIREKTFRLNNDYISYIEYGLAVTPFIVNSLLYRSYNSSQDFEEDTFLDMYIYQTGKKLGKKTAGMETIFTMEKYTTEAEIDRNLEKKKKWKAKSYDNYPEMSAAEAYRKGDLDMIDSLDKIDDESEAFTEKFLYQRNDVQAASMDTIMKKGESLFVGVGAAHLPGKRGVIEILRKMGYKLRPIKMVDRDATQRDKIDKLRVPVNFVENKALDGVYTVKAPGEMYGRQDGLSDFTKQYCDMANGAYYMVTRVPTYADFANEKDDKVLKKVDSLLYENVPGKILKKEKITKNGYNGFNVINKTRRGDMQQYQIFALPNEIIIFKISGVDNYIELGNEASTFFNSITLKSLKEQNSNLVKYKRGNFSVDFPASKQETLTESRILLLGKQNNVAYELHQLQIDSRFEVMDTLTIMLMEESLTGDKKVVKTLFRKYNKNNTYAQLDAHYKYADSFLTAKYIINGEQVYLLTAKGTNEKLVKDNLVLPSFTILKNEPIKAELFVDTFLHFQVQTPYKPILEDSLKGLLFKLKNSGSRYSDNSEPKYERASIDRYMSFRNDSTGETISVALEKYGKYEHRNDSLKKIPKMLDSVNALWNNPSKLAKYADSLYKVNYKSYENYYDINYIQRKKELSKVDGFWVWEEHYTDTGINKLLVMKTYSKDDVYYMIRATTDTSYTSSFIKTFLNTFKPITNKLKFDDIYQSKVDLFFKDYYGTDTVNRKIAIDALFGFDFDWKDLPKMQEALAKLSTKDKDYYTLKNKWISKIVYTADTSKAQQDFVFNFLKQQYEKHRDTSLFTNAILGHLVGMKTAASFDLFKKYLLQDPPLEVSSYDYGGSYGNYSSSNSYEKGFYFSDVSDSLELARTLFPEVLQLTNIDEYESKVTGLLQDLIDSNKIAAKDYESYSSKLLFDAKIALKKKQLAQEKKRKSLQEAEPEDLEDEAKSVAAASTSSYSYNSDMGLSDYIGLLMPFYNSNEAIPTLINKIWALDDDQLKYILLFKMIKENKPYPDTIINYYAKEEINRGHLYYKLSKLKKENLFPAKYLKQDIMARAFLYTTIDWKDKMDSIDLKEWEDKYGSDTYSDDNGRNYDNDYPRTYTSAYNYDYNSGENKKLDSIEFIKKLTTTINKKTGIIYIYKYRKLKEDKWRFAFSGLQPIDGKSISYKNYITDLTDTKLDDKKSIEEQIERELKKLNFSKNKFTEDFFESESSGRRNYYH